MQIRTILCPIDFSDASREAVHYAADLSRQYGASLRLLHVYQVPGYAYPEGIVLAGPEVLSDLLARIERALEDWRRDALKQGALHVTTEAQQGTAWTEIVRYAEAGPYDLVVLGTHGRTGLSHVLLGSVAEKVVRRCPVPVLTVRPRAHEAEEAPAP